MVTCILFRVGWLYYNILCIEGSVLLLRLLSGYMYAVGGWDDSMYSGICFIFRACYFGTMRIY